MHDLTWFTFPIKDHSPIYNIKVFCIIFIPQLENSSTHTSASSTTCAFRDFFSMLPYWDARIYSLANHFYSHNTHTMKFTTLLSLSSMALGLFSPLAAAQEGGQCELSTNPVGGCQDGYCWRRCNLGSLLKGGRDGSWCWQATNPTGKFSDRGTGPWKTCKQNSDCTGEAACGVGPCKDCGCFCSK